MRWPSNRILMSLYSSTWSRLSPGLDIAPSPCPSH